MNAKFNTYLFLICLLSLSLTSAYQYRTCSHTSALDDLSDPMYNVNQLDSLYYFNPSYVTDGFDFPVGKPNAENYYLASKFGQRNHLGEDWNGRGGGNSDLGDPVYAVADGVITFSEEVCCGWGNVIRVIHKLDNNPELTYVESVYAHLDRIDVSAGQKVKRGDLVGTIGTANGTYLAHLHLEMRDFINMSLGPGYSEDRFGYLAPSDFINSNRPGR